MANAVVRPLDDLSDVLRRMMEGDLKIDISDPTRQCSSDILELYQVFRKLKVVLRFGEKEYFMRNDAETLINLSQALKLFEECGNVKGVRVCCNSIGAIHLRQQRFAESVEYYSRAHASALVVALNKLQTKGEELDGLKLLLVSTNNLVFALMEETRLFVRNNMKEAIVLLADTIERCAELDKTQGFVNSLLLLTEAYALDGQLQLSQSTLSRAESIIHNRGTTLSVPFSIVEERLLFLKGLLAETHGQDQTAAELYTDCLVLNELCDASIRAKCLHRLQLIFERQNIESWEVSRLLDECKITNMDIVFLVDYSAHMKATGLVQGIVDCLLQFFDSIIQSEDRISLVLIGKSNRTAFHLSQKAVNTEFLRTRLQQSTQPNECAESPLLDGLLAAISELSDSSIIEDCELLNLPVDFAQTTARRRAKWIVAVTASGDVGSVANIDCVQRAFLAHPGVDLFTISLGLFGSDVDRLAALCSLTRRGRLSECSNETGLRETFRSLAQTISPLTRA